MRFNSYDITKCVIPKNVKLKSSNWSSAFSYCDALRDCEILPTSITSMSKMFYRCYNLVNSIVDVSNVTNMS